MRRGVCNAAKAGRQGRKVSIGLVLLTEVGGWMEKEFGDAVEEKADTRVKPEYDGIGRIKLTFAKALLRQSSKRMILSAAKAATESAPYVCTVLRLPRVENV